MAVAAQFLVEQGVLLFDKLGFQQQGAYFPGCADVCDTSRLAQHSRFIRIAQMGEQASAEVHALAYVKRQSTFLSVEGIDPGGAGCRLHARAQVLRIAVEELVWLRFAVGQFKCRVMIENWLYIQYKLQHRQEAELPLCICPQTPWSELWISAGEVL